MPIGLSKLLYLKLNSSTYKILCYSYSIFLILISVLPINSSGSSINHTFVVSIRLDYLLHCAIFIPWVFLIQKITRLSFGRFPKKTFVLLVAGVLFAFTMEAIQYILPYRAFNINDLLANGLGILLGSVVFLNVNQFFSPIKALIFTKSNSTKKLL